MKLHVWGIDFKRSTSEERRPLFIPIELREETLKNFIALGFHDLVYLWTCNRVEFYTSAEDYFVDLAPQFLKLLSSLGLEEWFYYKGYHFEGKAALRHLIRVASSLESLVIGEPQILGQLKESISFSKESQIPVQKSMERSFHLAFETAKKIRSTTAIAEKSVSVASLGLERLKARLDTVPLKEAVLVGRSPMNLLILQWLEKNHPEVKKVWVNRRPEILKDYSEASNCEIRSLSDFISAPGDFSHLFTATSSSQAIFDQQFIEKVDGKHRLIFDFAEPPDFIPFTSKHLEMCHVEDLRKEAMVNTESRKSATKDAECLTEAALKEFLLEQKEAPLLRDFNAVEPKFEEERLSAFDYIEKEYPVEMQVRLKKFVEKIISKNLHVSREHLKSVLRKVVSSEVRV